MNSSLIISIGISLILCGAVVYYCNSRLNNVEMAIMRQNQVLTSFIANVQNELRGSSIGDACQRPVQLKEDVSSAEARESAEAQSSKIVVSDDDESDTDDDSSESDTDDENENENENEDKIVIKEIILSDIMDINHNNNHNNNNNNNNNNNTHHIKLVDIHDLSMLLRVEEDPTQSTIYEIKDDDSSSESDDESEAEAEAESKAEAENKSETENKSEAENKSEPVAKVEEIFINKNIKIKIEPDDDTDKPVSVQTPLKHDQMRVDDLRKLVVDKNLSTKEEVKKLKKAELLALLPTNSTF